MKRNIFLIGFMGAGKTTVARALHERCGMQLLEMDEKIEAQEGKSISRIFDEDGEAYFRSLETKLLEELKGRENTVISCGGGVPMRAANVGAMRESGSIVYLSAEPGTICARIRDEHTRPLLEGHMNVAYIEGLLRERLPYYQSAADLSVATDNRSPDEICEAILEALEN